MAFDSFTTRGWRARALALFPEREVFLRSNGRLRFVRISSRTQLTAVTVVAIVALGWLIVTTVMLLHRAEVAGEQARLTQERSSVAAKAREVTAYRRSAAGIAAELEQRQTLIEQLVRARVGPVAPESDQSKPDRPIAALPEGELPDAARLNRLAATQDAFARALASTFETRATRAATALRALGLDPAAMLARAATAQGGPLIVWPAAASATPALRQLAAAIAHLDVLEDNLVAVPSGLPTHAQMITSSYGVRADPFTGAPAFHAGLDFIGAFGQPILAAAAGRVAFVGDRSGYGHVVEIDHGNGMLTRYAHLSAFATTVGRIVGRGEPIARMGSTGRSTGTHLHFEVRMNGAPINPRRFLQASQDVLDVQQTAIAGSDHGHAGH